MPTKISRFCEGLMEAGWLAAILLGPLFFDLYSARIFEPDKIALIRTITLIVLGAWLVKIINQRGWTWDRIQPNEPTWRWLLKFPVAGWAAAVIVVYLIATIFSVTPAISLWGSYQRLQGTYSMLSYIVIFAAILSNLRRRVQVERIITTAILSSLPVVLYGFIQRYKLDPVPWGGDTIRRIASTAGNSIFVGAYLIMVFPLTVMRAVQSFRDILRGQTRNTLITGIIRGTIYTFLVAVQIIALYMTGSRGPALGWLVGIVFLMLLLAYVYQKRWLTASFVSLGALLAIFLVIFQIPGGPLDALRKSPAVGRFGSLLDAESNSAKVRKYIWEGAANLVKPHDPLYFPNGSTDMFNAVRPVVGYGPESMYVAYNQFYVPNLGQVERRNASPDRSHNETWDWLVQTGVLGLIVYIGLFTTVFYYAVKYLGMISTSGDRILFLSLVGVGGLIGAVGMAVWREVAYFGVGLPVGIVAGMGLFIIYKSLFGTYRIISGPNERARLLLLAALLAAIVGHYVEINFGIAILATRTYFWVFAALIVVVGYLLPLHGEYRDGGEIKAEPAAAPVEERTGKPRKKLVRTSIRAPQNRADWLQNAWIYGWILGLLLMSLGYSLILNNKHLTNPFAIIWNALTGLTVKNVETTSFGILGLIVMTVLFGGLLLIAEVVKDETNAGWLQAVRIVFGISLIPAVIYWIWNASELAILESFKPSTYEGMLAQIDRIGGLLTWFYIFVVMLMILMAFSLRERSVSKGNPDTTPSWIAGGIVSIAAILLIVFTNLKIVHADITFKMAEPFNKPKQWQTASLIYDYANQQAPNEDHYFLFLARSYMEQAKEVTDDTDVGKLVNTTEQKLQRAQRINPLNTDHTANLARLYTWYAGKTTSKEERAARAEKAYQYYDTALKLSPNNSTLWGEWASLLIRIMNRPDDAYQMIEKALELDPKYTLTQGLAGDYWVTKASTETDETKKAEDYASAAEHYMDAAAAAKTRDEATSKLEFLKRSGNIYVQLNRLPEAAAAYEELIEANPTGPDVWSYEETLAKIYIQLNDKANALTHAQAALKSAPADKEAEVQSIIDQIQAMP